MILYGIAIPIASIAIAIGTMALPCGFAAELGNDFESRVRERAQRLVDEHAVLGTAIGIVRADATTTVFVGKAAVAGLPPDERTLFEIGSVSKTFTGILLADAVELGEVRLDEPVGDLLGPNIAVPTFEDQPIRLVDLGTQTSGLPRLPSNVVFVNPFNPYAHYHEADLLAFLAEHKPARAPGKEYEYSNLGMGLLGFALAKRAKKSYEELLVERICKPLKMNDTVVTLSKEQDARMASGISMLGLPAMRWDFPTLAGCGGIRSTLADMLVFVGANLSPKKTPLAKAIELSHSPRFTVKEPTEKSPAKIEIGLAWHITTKDGETIIWHNGRTGGYAAYVAIVPAKKIGLVVLANTATSSADKLGNDLLTELIAQ